MDHVDNLVTLVFGLAQQEIKLVFHPGISRLLEGVLVVSKSNSVSQISTAFQLFCYHPPDTFLVTKYICQGAFRS